MTNERQELLDYMDKNQRWYTYTLWPLKYPVNIGILCYDGDPVNKFAFVRKTGEYQTFFIKFSTEPDPTKPLHIAVEGKMYKILPLDSYLKPIPHGNNVFENVELEMNVNDNVYWTTEYQNALAQDLHNVLSMENG